MSAGLGGCKGGDMWEAEGGAGLSAWAAGSVLSASCWHMMKIIAFIQSLSVLII